MSAVKIGQWISFAPNGRTYGEGGASSVSAAAIPTGTTPWATEPWHRLKMVTEAGIKTAGDGAESIMAPPDDMTTGAYMPVEVVPGTNVQEWTFSVADVTTDLAKALLFGRKDITGTLTEGFRPNQANQWNGWIRITQKTQDGTTFMTHVLWGVLTNAGEVKIGNKAVSHGLKFTVLDNAANLSDPNPA